MATLYLKRGGIFKDKFVAYLPVSHSVKEFRKTVNIWGSYGKSLVSLFSKKNKQAKHTCRHQHAKFAESANIKDNCADETFSDLSELLSGSRSMHTMPD